MSVTSEKGLNALPELLAPAGSDEALTAALAAGADAVYFGGSAFSNRMRAKNFTDDGLTEAIRRVHGAGAKAHITVNTRVRDREMDDALRLAERILGGTEDERADAVIIADLGLAREIRARWPHAVFHASTQTSLGSLGDCLTLAEAGFARLVLPREFSREEIAALIRELRGALEIEIFVHGAHCVSLSGQCLMSYFCGGRSGNRGECAQPCRLPYRVGEIDLPAEAALSRTNAGERRQTGKKGTPTPLSLADMCLAGRISDVLAVGVDSLKIEGRLKSPGYVYGVTSIYRRLLDERRDAEPEEIRALEDLFSRGFTDGYFAGRPGSGSMAGKPPRGEEEKQKQSGKSANAETPGLAQMEKEAARRAREHAERIEAGEKKRLSAVCTVRRGEPSVLVLRTGEEDGAVIEGRAEGQIPGEAEGKPLDGPSAARNLTKLGGTGFELDPADIAFEIEDGLWLPASALNDLRRRAVEELSRKAKPEAGSDPSAEKPAGGKRDYAPYVFPAPPPGSETIEGKTGFCPERCALDVADAGLLEGDPEVVRGILNRFARVFVPAEQAGRAREVFDRLKLGTGESLPELCADLPPFPMACEREMIRTLNEAGIRRIRAHGIGGARLAREFTVDLSFRGNVTNGAAAMVYRDAGFSEIGLSPELPSGGIRAIARLCPVSCAAYGRIPVMTLARCVLKEQNGGCRGAGGRRDFWKTSYCRGSLTDRMDERFPVLGAGNCVNIVYNARPIWMADRLDQLDGASLRFCWTTESPEEMRSVLNRYETGSPGEGRRIQ
ncbi:MAG: U32 family peptidase [Ruminococcaceae bacterium]|jgi:putative protease|nr:U32 family peptidase [Oscillospiraceae bacterium]